ncbi:MAG: nucleoside triphosphate pyrophosphohydrolase, partial [Deltaproteobacteria bacterium CG11_big_fil_rev_8_21_14_0_20_49_13]
KFEELVNIMAKLRGPKGCPWDKEQTPESISPYLLEETYETLEAIDSGDVNETREELGDLLLQVVFHAQMANEKSKFDVCDVIDGICRKLIHRHPHVFGKDKVKDSWNVLQNWEKLKKREGKKTMLGGVPKTLPALLKAFRLGQKASRVGFDWQDAEGVLEKVEEEARELHEANKKGRKKDVEHEYGDLLLILANLGRFLDIDPETALRKATGRFISRFNWMEKEIAKQKLEMHDLSAKEWNNLWEKAKAAE